MIELFNMFFYIVIYILIYFFALIESKWQIQNIKNIYIIFILIFFVLSFLRWERGTDWYSYYNFFNKNVTLEDFQKDGREPLFTYANYFFRNTFVFYTVFLFFQASIIYILKGYCIAKYSPMPIFSLLPFLVLFKGDVFFVRETVSLSILFFSYIFILEKRKMPFLLCVLISTFIHWSSLAFIIAYPLFNLKLKVRNCLIIFLLSVVVSLFWGSDLLLYLGKLLGGDFYWKISAYIEYGDRDFGGYGVSMKQSIIRGLVNRGLLMVLIFPFWIRNRDDKLINGLFNFYFMSIVIFLICAPISLVLVRLSNAYELSLLLLLSMYLVTQQRVKRTILVLLLGIYFFIRFYVSFLTGGYSHLYVPYQSIFS